MRASYPLFRRFFPPLIWVAAVVTVACVEGPTRPASAPVTGAVDVVTFTTGSDLDPDGYTIVIDGARGPSIALNETISLSDLNPGEHTIELRDIASSCGVNASNPQTVEVTAGETARAIFRVICDAKTGSIEVTVATTTGGLAPDLDPDGYEIRIVGRLVRAVGINSTTSFSGLEADEYEIELLDVARNCAVGANPQNVTIVEGERVDVIFQVRCAPSGTVDITATTETTGTSLDLDPDGYEIRIDDSVEGTMEINGAISFDRLVEGDHSVELLGVDSNCDVVGPNPQTVQIAHGEISSVDFAVQCAFVPRTMTFGRGGLQAVTGGIWIMSAAGSSQRQLTRTLDDWQPAWSPDGARIAFTRGDLFFTGVPGDIWIMDADGSNTVNLTDDRTSDDADPAWSPDGERIAFTGEVQGNSDIYIMDADGDNRLKLTDHPASDYAPAWSPDGTRIAFVSDRDGDSDIYIMNTDGGDLGNLTEDLASDFAPAWSPDGTRIAFMSRRDGNFEIYVMDADGSDPMNVSDDPADDTYPAWSPDGTRIVFVSSRGGSSDIWTMGADGSEPTSLTNDPFSYDFDPDWTSSR